MDIHNGEACYGGYIFVEESDGRRARRCRQCAVDDFFRRFGGRQMTWENWTHREEISGSVLRLQTWIPRGSNMTCLLYGMSNPSHGYNGKTHALCATGIEFLRNGRDARYWNAADLVDRRYESFGESLAEYRSIALIDDFGNEADTHSTHDAFDRLLDLRMRLYRPTIVATSLALHSILQRYPRFHARLRTATTIPWDAEPYTESEVRA